MALLNLSVNMSKQHEANKVSAKEGVGVILVGDGITALSALRSLVETCDVLGVLQSHVDDGVNSVREFAAECRIPIWQLSGLSDLTRRIMNVRPQVVVVSSFNKILPATILELTRFVNVHYSPLPLYRGRANVNWAIINGERTAGISIHLMTPGLDDGNILFQAKIEISRTDTAQSLYDQLNAIQEKELGRAVASAARGISGWRQNHMEATYGCGRLPDDGEINWHNSSAAIDRQIRALSPPFPGAFTYIGHRRLVIARAEPRNDPPSYDGRIPGRVVGRSAREGWVDVLTGDGIYRLFEVSSGSAEREPAAAIVLSTRATLGILRLDLVRRIESLEERLAKLEEAAHERKDPVVN